MNPFTLEGKTLLVTGASSGIGKATAILCAEMGAKVIALGRDCQRLAETMDSLTGEGHAKMVLDLTDEKAVEAALSEMPSLDGIANCAGIVCMNPFQFVSQKEMETLLATGNAILAECSKKDDKG